MSNERYEHFKVLGVTVNATAEEIKKAYRRKARDVHPDRNASEQAHEVFIRLKKAYDFLSDGKKRIVIQEDSQQAQSLAEKYANRHAEQLRQRHTPATSRFSSKPEVTFVKLKLNWNPLHAKYTVRHLMRILKAEKIVEEGGGTCATGNAFALFKSDEDALDGHILCLETKPKPINAPGFSETHARHLVITCLRNIRFSVRKTVSRLLPECHILPVSVEWITEMPKIAKDLLAASDDCIIIEKPKKPKKRKRDEKSKYDRGYYKEIHDDEKREADYDKQWARRATK